jgi:hypothetical protein
MNEIKYLDTTYSPIVLPKRTTIFKPKLEFTHEINRIDAKNLSIEVKVFLSFIEQRDGSKHDIFNAKSKFLIKIEDELTNKDLFSIWDKSAKLLTAEYSKFEKKKKMNHMNIHVPDEKEIETFLSNLVAWYYSP